MYMNKLYCKLYYKLYFNCPKRLENFFQLNYYTLCKANCQNKMSCEVRQIW